MIICNVHRALLRRVLTSICNRRHYKSRAGVYGFKPFVNEQYEVAETILQKRLENFKLHGLITAYREHGHKRANLDPLLLQETGDVPELTPGRYGFSSDSVDAVDLDGLLHTDPHPHTVGDLIDTLNSEYCGTIGAEFAHLTCEEERDWFAEAFEKKNKNVLSTEKRVNLAKTLLKCQACDHYLASKFSTIKRYGGEGCESMMGIFQEINNKSAENGVSDVCVCMPHRGRINFMICVLNFPPVIIFNKMMGKSEIPSDAKGSGDILTHLYTSVDLDVDGKKVHVSLIPNPSHLETNCPVIVGKTRAKQQSKGEGDYSVTDAGRPGDNVVCVQVHGDAAYSGQGVSQETSALSESPHFRVGGSIHVIVNNQVGFTTEADRARSSRYSSDIAKINGNPVLHVNGDFPEDVVRATAIAMDYQQKFRKDVIIDLICFRKLGHNELDDPSFTQPIMYGAINSRKSIPDVYKDKLLTDGVCQPEDLSGAISDWNSYLSEAIKEAESHVPKLFYLQNLWSSCRQAPSEITTWDTGLPRDLLSYIGAKSVNLPEEFMVHPTLVKGHIKRRIQKLQEGTQLDWATAEALAIGSLLCQGYNVRLSGQDSGRGTFSHRHAMLVDQKTDEIYIPLNDIMPEQAGKFEVVNCLLSEEAVLSFEYGMSLESPNNLVIWEAQFGDFFNSAQVIIDTYISSGETKWMIQSGLVILLPHGFDGAGPEHSSCRMERFLQSCDSNEDGIDGEDVNMNIVNPTTPAQYYHLLRRQILRDFRKPLIVVAPKVLLRLSTAVSSLDDMSPGTSFQPVLPDNVPKPDAVTKVVFCSGKHFYALQKRRNEAGSASAIVRLESLCPFPADEIRKEMKKYRNATDFIWSQEEHRNMGAWSFVSPRFENIVGCKLTYKGRGPLAAPATGIGVQHDKEVQELFTGLF